MKIYLGTDHAGFQLKEKIKDFLIDLKYEVTDCGSFSCDETDDYPDFVIPVAKYVGQDDTSFGIIFGGSGQGEAICSNKHKNIRAVVYYGKNLEISKIAREHNDANILSLGARFITEEEAMEAVKIFLSTPFSNDERHIRRIKKINEIN